MLCLQEHLITFRMPLLHKRCFQIKLWMQFKPALPRRWGVQMKYVRAQAAARISLAALLHGPYHTHAQEQTIKSSPLN